jgi:transglutaminase-like putative cysteine protease
LLLGALALVVAPHLVRLPLAVGAACAAVIGWRVLRELRGWALPHRAVNLVLTLAGFAAVLLAYRSVLGREPGVALLTVMLCLKLLELRTLRDAMVVIFLGYFLVVAGFLFSQSLLVGGYLFLVVLVLTAALIALNHPEATLQRTRGYFRLAAALLVQALPVMLLLFVLFPRISGPLWGMPQGPTGARTGLSDEMRLGTISNLADSPEVAFRVDFDGSPPAADRLYWRGPVLWNTDGREWTVSQPNQRRYPGAGRPDYAALDDGIGYSVTLEPHNRRWLFALDLPAAVPPKAGLRADYQLVAGEPIKEVFRYRMRSHLMYRTGELDPDQLFMALSVPNAVNPRSRLLAEGWRRQGLDDAAIVREALALFRDGPYYYTRQPPLLTGPDPVDGFLFDTRRGFCEHFAAGFVTLMRHADVPARVVTGYQGGEVNPVGGYLIVRQSDAHAWAEVWLEGAGWVRIDPTSVVPAARIEALEDTQRFVSTGPAPLSEEQIAWLTQAFRTLRNGWDAVDHTWNDWVLGFDQERQQELLRKIGIGALDWRQLVVALLGAVGGTFALVSLYILWPRGGIRDPTQALYSRFCRKLARRGLARDPAEGPLAYAERVAAARPECAGEVRAITRAYTRLRYGGGNPERWLPRLKARVVAFKP